MTWSTTDIPTYMRGDQEGNCNKLFEILTSVLEGVYVSVSVGAYVIVGIGD